MSFLKIFHLIFHQYLFVIVDGFVQHWQTRNHTHTNTHTYVDEIKFQNKSCGDSMSWPRLVPSEANVLGPRLGNGCQPTLGGPVNNGPSQEQVVVTWNCERWVCISDRACVCVYSMCVCVCVTETGLSAIWTIPIEVETQMCCFYQFTDWPLPWIHPCTFIFWERTQWCALLCL